jgi:hypothetical protein
MCSLMDGKFPFLSPTFLVARCRYTGQLLWGSESNTHMQTNKQTHTHTRVTSPLDERSARPIKINLRKHSTYKRQTFMSLAGFEFAVLRKRTG